MPHHITTLIQILIQVHKSKLLVIIMDDGAVCLDHYEINRIIVLERIRKKKKQNL